MGGEGKKSFVEAVKGEEQQDKWKGGSIKNTNACSALDGKKCYWAVQGWYGFRSAGEESVKGGLHKIKMRFLGDKLALMTPREGENIGDIIKPNREWFDNFFTSIKPWSVFSVVDHKIV